MASKDLIVLNMEPKSNNDFANAGICTMESMGFRLNPYFNYYALLGTPARGLFVK
jgi:hypothetical protein